jgi:hypothetical protein
MKALKPALILTFMLLIVSTAGAVVINGGKGLPHTSSAWVMETGRLTFLSHSRFWGKVGQEIDQKTKLTTALTVWDVQGLINFNYGLGKHFELGVTPIVYQDDQSKTGVYPWDTFIGLKIGSFGSKASSLNYGAQLNVRFPTGNTKNIPFEEYSAGTTEWGFNGLLSYAYDPLYPEDAFNLHLNLGYLNHNDAGEILTSNALDPNSRVLHQSQEGLYALGFLIPSEGFDYGLEMYGNFWMQKPPPAAISREPYLYLNASVNYKAYRWFTFTVSGDYRLTSDKDESVAPSLSPRDMPNYNTWRINVGAKVTLLPTSIFRTTERDILMQKAESRRELFEQIIKERRETESAEEELERIKEERRKAERELERLRKILEGSSQSGQQTPESMPTAP